jgi:uncharacterized protein YcfJ
LFAHLPQKAPEMKKSLFKITPILLSALATGIVLSLPVQAQTSYHDAQVIEYTAIYRVIETPVPSRQCWEEEVVRSSSRHHYRSHTPGLLGAVIGGAIGNALGNHRSSQRVGAVVGAMLGGSIARDIAESQYNPDVRLETVERCKTDYSYQQEEKLVGYDVLYRYNGADYTVRMPDNPGPTIRVRVNVEPVI